MLTQPQGRFSESGFLGPKYKPFATGGDPNGQRFDVEGVVKLPLVDPVVERELGFIVRRGHLLSPAAEALMESVRQVSETALVV